MSELGREVVAGDKPTVFVSHAGPDGDIAIDLANRLADVGIEARVDQLELRVGDNIVTWMNSAIGESDYLLVLLSPRSIDRHWVETEWSNALMKEAYLRRTFVIPVILPGLSDEQIPDLLRARLFVDLRIDQEKAFLQIVSRLKEDALAERELGRRPSPAPRNVCEHINEHFGDNTELIEVIVHSNRFGRSFRLRVPKTSTPSYLIGMLRNTLSLKYSNVDETLGVELSYTYYLRHNGKAITLNRTLEDAGVTDGSRLELWIRVTLRDLIQDKEIGEKVFSMLYRTDLSNLEAIGGARKRVFSSVDIARVTSQFFRHVDE